MTLRVLAAFGVVVALMVVVGVFAVVRLGSDNRHLGQLAARVVPSTRAVGDINALMNKYRKDQLHYVVARASDRPGGSGIAGDLAGDVSLMSRYLSAYRAERLSDGRVDGRLLDRFQAEFARYVALSAPFRALADAGHPLAAGEAIGDGASDDEYNVLKALITAWGDHKVNTANAAAGASRASYEVGVTLILCLLAVAMLIATVIAVGLARTTIRAVRQIGAAAKAIAHGDIDQRVAITSRDELGEMARDFDAMIEYLRSTVAIAETIADGDFSVEVHPRSDKDALGHSLALMTSSLRGLAAENEILLTASRHEAHTDALTGLANRRALMRELEEQLAGAGDQHELMLALFDLDGFKQYNDTFGHPAGDALLARVSERLQRVLEGSATAYRMGGDEFCVLAHVGASEGAAIAKRAASALGEHGEAFTIGCSYGLTILPAEAATAEDALRSADQRMYERKNGRVSAGRQSTDVLLKVLAERSPGLQEHIAGVAAFAVATAHALHLPEHEVKRIQIAAELHDIGKAAIPDSILNKPGPLDEEEWDYMRRHTVIGERIVLAAPSLAPSAALVRASHERHDGTGYPDHLAGDDIPLGASIIAVCDAYDAMINDRPYSHAITHNDALHELHRCAGSQFHPNVVQAFTTMLHTPTHTQARAA